MNVKGRLRVLTKKVILLYPVFCLFATAVFLDSAKGTLAVRDLVISQVFYILCLSVSEFEANLTEESPTTLVTKILEDEYQMLPRAQNTVVNAFTALIELNLQNGEAGVEREFFQAVESALNCLVLKTLTDGSDPDERTSVFSPATSFVALHDSDGPKETFSFLDNAGCSCRNKSNTDFGLILWNYKGV